MADLIIHLRGGCIEGIENNTNTTLKINIVDHDLYNDEGEKGIESFIESRGDSYEGIVPHISDQPKKYNVNGSTYIVAKMP